MKHWIIPANPRTYKLDDALYPFTDERGDYGLITLDKASIQFSQSLVFDITGPDGTIYTLAMREMAYREGRGMETVDLMNGKLDEWTAPTAWHLTSMRSRSGLETATFTYSDAAIWDRSIITRTETLSVTCGIVQGTPSRNISSNNESLFVNVNII